MVLLLYLALPTYSPLPNLLAKASSASHDLSRATASPLTLKPFAAAESRTTLASSCPHDPSLLCLKMVVNQDGIYRVSAQALAEAGWSLPAVDPRTFGLSTQDESADGQGSKAEVAIRVPGEEDGRLDPGDYVEFYGQRFRGDEMAEKYTDENVYWLAACADQAPAECPATGPRMGQIDATPTGAPPAPDSFWTTHRAEQNRYWFTHHALNWPSKDTWWWQRMIVSTQDDFLLPTEVPAPAPENYTATLSLEVGTRRQVGTHHIQAHWNDEEEPLLDELFTGHQLYRTQASLPGSALLEGTNTLVVSVLNDQSRESGSTDADQTPWYGPEWVEVWQATQGILGQLLAAPGDATPGYLRGQGSEGSNATPFSPSALASHEDSPAGPDRYATDELYFNYYELRYRRRYEAVAGQLPFSGDPVGLRTIRITGLNSPNLLLYDVSDPRQPQQVGGFQVGFAPDGSRSLTAQLELHPDRTYLALEDSQVKEPVSVTAPLSSVVRSTQNGADWIAISHRDFLPAAQRLADFRASHDGMRSAVVAVDELYEQFNDGIFHPEAIRRFISYAVENWQPPAPQYILLLGDGHWNFKGYGADIYGVPDPIWIPPFLVWEDPWQGEVGSDNALVDLDITTPVPELAIGRLPARTLQEADAMVDKIIAYETQDQVFGQTIPSWHRRALFVADNADTTGNYPEVAEGVVTEHLPGAIQPRRAYLGVTHAEPAEVTDAIVSEVNNGALLVNYLGHGSVNWWAHEQIWTTSLTGELTNVDRLPVVVTLNCLDGYFIHGTASLQAVAEEMLRHPTGGSIASWSPAGLGTTSVENILHTAFLDALLTNQTGDPIAAEHRLGPATVRAKAALFDTLGAASPVYTTLIHTMTLFGDPALSVPVPETWQRLLPLTLRGPSR